MQQMRQVRELIALAMLAVSSYTDIREKCIYLFPVAICTAGAVALTVTSSFFSSVTEAGEVLLRELFSPAATGILLIIVVKAGKAHIGEGDGYLTAALWMILGLRTGIYTVIAGLFILLAASSVILISGRRRVHRLIPFAPFILAGYLSVLIYEIYRENL